MSRSYKRGIGKCKAGSNSAKTWFKRHSNRRFRRHSKQKDISTSGSMYGSYRYVKGMLTWSIDDWVWTAKYDDRIRYHGWLIRWAMDDQGKFYQLPKKEWKSGCHTYLEAKDDYFSYYKHWWKKNKHRYNKDYLKIFRK